MADCLECPKGFYCPNNAADQFSKIVKCPAGLYCPGGAYSSTADNLKTFTCPIGYYCPEGSNVPLPCKVGYYCATAGLSTPTGPCTAGYYCLIKQINTLPLSLCMNNVSTGCVIGAITAQGKNEVTDAARECPEGHYCPLGTFMPIACPIGKYLPTKRAVADTDCVSCLAGDYCEHRGQIAVGTNCQAGYYCTTGSSNEYQNRCPAGSKCPQGSSTPEKCPVGTYQPNEVSNMCKTCPERFECPSLGMIVPNICRVGFFCPTGTGVPLATNVCPSG